MRAHVQFNSNGVESGQYVQYLVLALSSEYFLHSNILDDPMHTVNDKLLTSGPSMLSTLRSTGNAEAQIDFLLDLQRRITTYSFRQLRNILAHYPGILMVLTPHGVGDSCVAVVYGLFSAYKDW